METQQAEIEYVEIVKHFGFVLSLCRLYSDTHPTAQQAVKNFLIKLGAILNSEPSFTFGFVDGQLIFNDHPIIDKTPSVTNLMRELNRLQIESLGFDQGVDEGEIISFFKLMVSPAKVLEQTGGYKKAFEEAQFQHIRLDTARYQKIKEDAAVVQETHCMEEVIEHCLTGTEGEISFDAERLTYEVEKKPDSVAAQMIHRADNLEALQRIVQGMGRFLQRRLARPLIQEGKDFSPPIYRLAKHFKKVAQAPETRNDFKESAEELVSILERCADGIKVELIAKAFQDSGGDAKSLAKIAGKFLRGKEARERLLQPVKEKLADLGIEEKELDQAIEEKKLQPHRVEQKTVLFDPEKRRALHEVNLALGSTLDLDTIVDVLLEKSSSFIPHPTAATFMSMNNETGELEPVSCRNLDEAAWKSEEWKATRELSKLVIDKGVPLVIDNVQMDPRIKDREFLSRNSLVSYLGIPLIGKARVGVLDMFTKVEIRFSQEAVGFLSMVAEQGTTAIQHAKVHGGLKKLADELTKANKAKDEFLSVMSHELRTPLTAITGYTALVIDRVLGEINRPQEETLGKVMDRSKDLLGLIEGMLETTRLSIEKPKLGIEEFQVADLLNKLKLEYDVSLNKKLTLVWDFPSDLPSMKTDGAKLRHILQNLINNAIKFTELGQVAITALYLPKTRKVEFKVADTGMGIPKEIIPVIFEKFRQGDSSERRLYGGTGLGLYIVKKLTDLLGGEIEVESEPGKGSTFTVTLPLRSDFGNKEYMSSVTTPITAAAPPLKSDLKKKESRGAPGKQRILLVEDDMATVNVMQKGLEFLGYEVMVAKNCTEATDIATGEAPDIIVMDILMSKADGLQTARKIRRNPNTQAIPILAATAMVLPGDEKKCLEAGCDDYISKPMTHRQLGAAVMKLLKKRSK